LLRHHLDHRGARHAGDVADAVERHGHHRQREIVEGDAFHALADAALNRSASPAIFEAKMTIRR
jgi:hypothetical protein